MQIFARIPFASAISKNVRRCDDVLLSLFSRLPYLLGFSLISDPSDIGERYWQTGQWRLFGVFT